MWLTSLPLNLSSSQSDAESTKLLISLISSILLLSQTLYMLLRESLIHHHIHTKFTLLLFLENSEISSIKIAIIILNSEIVLVSKNSYLSRLQKVDLVSFYYFSHFYFYFYLFFIFLFLELWG